MIQDFTPLVYKVYGIADRDVRVADKWMVKLLAEKWQS